jgi:hypothetical protein
VSAATGLLKELLFPAPARVSPLAFWGRGLVFGLLLLWGLRLILSPMGQASHSVLHYVNLPFHEAGHVLFLPFGRFLQVLGGTLMQLIIPLVALLTLLLQSRDAFGASVAGWWLGQNFLDIAPYIGDARAGELMLLGGVTGRQAPGFHDWENILGRLGWLEHDRLLAALSFATGAGTMLLSLAWGGYGLYRQYQGIERDS